MHWAATGHTAAELIAARADAAKPNMGLTSWRGPKVRKADVTMRLVVEAAADETAFDEAVKKRPETPRRPRKGKGL